MKKNRVVLLLALVGSFSLSASKASEEALERLNAMKPFKMAQRPAITEEAVKAMLASLTAGLPTKADVDAMDAEAKAVQKTLADHDNFNAGVLKKFEEVHAAVGGQE